MNLMECTNHEGSFDCTPFCPKCYGHQFTKWKDYTITTWANGFGIWHAKATFTQPIGNSYEALQILDRAHDALRRAIRKEITERAATHNNATPLKGVRLKYEVKEFAQIASANLATSLTIAERVNND